MAAENIPTGSSRTMNHDESDYGTEVELNESDYGSDIDAATWEAVFTENESQQQFPSFKIEEFPSFGEDVPEPVIQDEPEAQTHSLRLARVRETITRAISGLTETCEQLDELEVELKQDLQQPPERTRRERSVEVEYDKFNRIAFTSESLNQPEASREADLLTIAIYSYRRDARRVARQGRYQVAD
jgi:exonuclease V